KPAATAYRCARTPCARAFRLPARSIRMLHACAVSEAPPISGHSATNPRLLPRPPDRLKLPSDLPQFLRQMENPNHAAGNQIAAHRARPALDFPVVGIGASAGGIQALIRFFEHMPRDPG